MRKDEMENGWNQIGICLFWKNPVIRFALAFVTCQQELESRDSAETFFRRQTQWKLTFQHNK